MERLPHDIHHYDRRLWLALSHLEESADIIPQNKSKILEYVRFRAAQELSVPRQVRYIQTLSKLSRLLQGGVFADATKPDMIAVVSSIDKERTAYDTKRTEKECIKCFYRWLRNPDDDAEKQFPPEVRWIKTSRKKNESRLPESFLTEEEVKRMAEAATNSRDRALILVNYETGGRVGETLPLSMGDVLFDKYGAILVVFGKTGSRRIRIIFSARALSDWLNDHPSRDDPNAPLWTSFDSLRSVKRLEYGALRKMLRSVADRCRPQITKRVTPKSFRHARATAVAGVLTEAQMKEYFGWTKDSKMPAIYVHLSGRNVDNALLKMNGIKTDEEVQTEERPLRPKFCERCREINSPVNNFCSKCGSPLDLKTALKVEEEWKTTDDVMNSLFEDPSFRSVFQEAVRKVLNQRRIVEAS